MRNEYEVRCKLGHTREMGYPTWVGHHVIQYRGVTIRKGPVIKEGLVRKEGLSTRVRDGLYETALSS